MRSVTGADKNNLAIGTISNRDGDAGSNFCTGQQYELLSTENPMETIQKETCINRSRLSNREAARCQRDGSFKVLAVDQARRLVMLADSEGRIVTIVKCSPESRVSSRRAGPRR